MVVAQLSLMSMLKLGNSRRYAPSIIAQVFRANPFAARAIPRDPVPRDPAPREPSRRAMTALDKVNQRLTTPENYLVGPEGRPTAGTSVRRARGE